MLTLRSSRCLFLLGALGVTGSIALGAPTTQPAPLTGDSAATQPAALAINHGAPIGAKEIDRRLDESVGPLHMENVAAKQVFAWWSESTDIELTINWTIVESDGLDPTSGVTIDAPRMSAEKMLRRIMDKFSPDQKMIATRTEYGVEIMTRAEANRHRVLRVYDIRDLIMMARIQPLGGQNNSPGTTGTTGASRSTGGYGTTAGSSGLASASSGSGSSVSNADAGAQIARLIRSTIEPSVWVENGGESTIDFFNGNLLVRAPLYVQIKIGQANAALSE